MKSPIHAFVQFLHYATAFGASPNGKLFFPHRAGGVQQTVSLQFVLQRAPADAEHIRRFGAIVRDVSESLADQ